MKSVSLGIALGISFACLFTPAFAIQEVRRDTLIIADTLRTVFEMSAEDLLEQATQDAEDSELLDRLQRLEENPLDLNVASVDEFQLIPGVTPIIAQKIVETRTRLGAFASLTDLLKVEGIDERLYAVVKRYSTLPRSQPTQVNFGIRSRAVRDIKDRRGFREGSYAGSPWKSYNRILVSYGSVLHIGVLTEKDAGEREFTDFASGYVMVKTSGPVSKVLVGDFLVEVGQALTVWRALAFSKGLDVIQPTKKSPRGVAPYVSSDESNFYRGGAVVLTNSFIEAMAFYSNKRVDATVDTLGQITSIYGSGYHRTLSELRRQSAVRERVAGGRLQLSLGRVVRISSTFASTRYDRAFLEKRLYDFSGKESRVIGADFDLFWENMNLFGEWARSHTGAIAGITGLFIRFARSADFVVSVRNYPRDFVSLHGYAFGERNGVTKNEFGIYTGLRLRVISGVLFSVYYDQFKFPWQTATIPFPIRGNDLLFAAELRPFRRFLAELKYKSEVKGDAVSALDEFGRTVKRLADRSQRNGRLTVASDVSRQVRVKGRVELVKVEYSEAKIGGKGILLYQDFRWRPHRQFTVDARVIFFDTDSYDTRIYEFESDLRGTLFNPALYGKGRRWYIIARYTLLRGMDISAKYSETYRDDVKKIGSGTDEIDGNMDNRVSAQIDIRF